jgi:hypothetical protein
MISDLIYLLEITDVDDLELSEKQVVQLGIHLLNNLRSDHLIPGKVYYQILGICDWYKENHFLSDKQRHWMYHNLKEYISQRDFSYEL